MCSSCHKYGYSINDRVLQRMAFGSQHIYRKELGWCIQAELFINHAGEFDNIDIYDKETGQHYRSTLDNFMFYKKEIQFKAGKQYLLRMSEWNKPAQVTPEYRPAKPQFEQIRMF
jgi:hypothetical protein